MRGPLESPLSPDLPGGRFSDLRPGIPAYEQWAQLTPLFKSTYRDMGYKLTHENQK